MVYYWYGGIVHETDSSTMPVIENTCSHIDKPNTISSMIFNGSLWATVVNGAMIVTGVSTSGNI